MSTTTQTNEPVTLIGIGRLGLPLALCIADTGKYNVIGCDSNTEMVESLQYGYITSKEPGLEALFNKIYPLGQVDDKPFFAVNSLEHAVRHSDLILILVPTPTGVEMPYDTTILSRLLQNVNNLKPKNKHVVICCTVEPGYCENVAIPLLSDCENLRLSYSPEFVAQGEVIEGFEHASLSLVGNCPKCTKEDTEKLLRLHKSISPAANACVMSLIEAEVTKLSLNTFLTLKIAYANCVQDLTARMGAGINADRILNAIGQDPRIGTRLLRPGYGFGGPCLSRDGRALAMAAEKAGFDASFLESIGVENKRHHVQMAKSILEEDGGQDPICFQYVTYKHPCAVDMIDASPTLEVAINIKTLDPNQQIVLEDRKGVLEMVKARYGRVFQYRER